MVEFCQAKSINDDQVDQVIQQLPVSLRKECS